MAIVVDYNDAVVPETKTLEQLHEEYITAQAEANFWQEELKICNEKKQGLFNTYICSKWREKLSQSELEAKRDIWRTKAELAYSAYKTALDLNDIRLDQTQVQTEIDLTLAKVEQERQKAITFATQASSSKAKNLFVWVGIGFAILAVAGLGIYTVKTVKKSK